MLKVNTQTLACSDGHATPESLKPRDSLIPHLDPRSNNIYPAGENIEEHAALLVTNLLVDLKILHAHGVAVIQVRKFMA